MVARRKLLGGLFAIGSLAFGVVAAFPLIRSLGPKPDGHFRRPTGGGTPSWSPWTAGR